MSKEKYQLTIYMAGITPENQTTIVNFKKQLSGSLGVDNYELKIIDVLDRPELAGEEKILATPTLVRSLPGPIKKFILDINNSKNMLVGLELIKKE